MKWSKENILEADAESWGDAEGAEGLFTNPDDELLCFSFPLFEFKENRGKKEEKLEKSREYSAGWLKDIFSYLLPSNPSFRLCVIISIFISYSYLAVLTHTWRNLAHNFHFSNFFSKPCNFWSVQIRSYYIQKRIVTQTFQPSCFFFFVFCA